MVTKKKLHRRCSIKKAALKNFAIFTGKTLVLESLFNRISRKDSNAGVSCEYCEILKNTYFEEHMRAAPYETCSLSLLLSSRGCVIVEYIILHNIQRVREKLTVLFFRYND